MFTHTAVRAAIAHACETPVSTIRSVEAGNNHSYRITLRDGCELFLKVGTRFPEAFPAEPETMEIVRRETDLPVPSVHATGTEPLGYPFAVYEFVGDSGYDWVGELSTDTAEQLCQEAGHHLASVHQLTLPAFGRVGVERSALTVVDPLSYREMLRQSLDRQLGALRDTPFASRRAAIEAVGREWIEEIEFDSIRPALVHGDYRLDNLRIETTDEPVTAAVLDWELPTAGDPLWDAVTSLTLLTSGHRIDPADRRSLRSAFWDGYGDPPSDPARWHCYELLARIRLARHLDTEMDGASERAVEARIDEHRDAFDDLLDGRSRFRRSPNAP